MPFTATDLLLGLVLPALFAGGTFYFLPRIVSSPLGQRVAASVAFVGGFQLGYWSLALGPLVPDAHWKWLPYLMLFPLVVGPVGGAPKVSVMGRFGLTFPVAIVAMWLLVPDWKSLQPPRAVYLAVGTSCLVALAMLLDSLAKRVDGRLLATALTLVLANAAVVALLSDSLRFANIIGVGAGALLGISVAAGWQKDRPEMTGIGLGCAILLCGMMLIAKVHSYSSVPTASYALITLAPLTLWLTVTGPVGEWRGAKGWLTRIGLPVGTSLIGVAIAAAFALG